jgi:predicted branched-subunit amino acid permease
MSLPSAIETKSPDYQPSARSEFWTGVRVVLPLLVGVAPFGMIYGALAVSAGMPVGAAQAMSAIVFAGSSQFATVPLAQGGAPSLVMILTIAVLNLRHALYSASIAPYLQNISPAWKAGLAYLLTDEAYAASIGLLEKSKASKTRHLYFLGTGLALWTTWQLSTAAGIFLGAVIPSSWPLDFTLALTFIAMVVPLVKDRAGVAAGLSAGIVAVAGYGIPYKLGLVAAALVGVAVGLLVEGKRK